MGKELGWANCGLDYLLRVSHSFLLVVLFLNAGDVLMCKWLRTAVGKAATVLLHSAFKYETAV